MNQLINELFLDYLKKTKELIEADGSIATIDEAIIRLEEALK